MAQYDLNKALKAESAGKKYLADAFVNFKGDIIKILAPIAPHICEEAWSMFGFNKTIFEQIEILSKAEECFKDLI